MNRPIFTLSVALSLYACKESRILSEPDRIAVNDAVRQMVSTVADSLRSKGLKAWIPYLDPEFKWEYQGKSWTYDAQVAGIRRADSMYRSITLVWDSIEVKPLSSTEAMFSANYREIAVDTNGVESTLLGSLEAHLIRTADGWKFHSGKSVGKAASFSE